MTQHQHHPSTMTGRVLDTPRLSQERDNRPTRTTFWIVGRYSGRRMRVHAVGETARAVVDRIQGGDVVTLSGVVSERSFDDQMHRLLNLDTFTIHPKDGQ